jgi:hypothetical protein
VRSARLLNGGQPVAFKASDYGTVLTLPKPLDPIDTIVVLEIGGR